MQWMRLQHNTVPLVMSLVQLPCIGADKLRFDYYCEEWTVPGTCSFRARAVLPLAGGDVAGPAPELGRFGDWRLSEALCEGQLGVSPPLDLHQGEIHSVLTRAGSFNFERHSRTNSCYLCGTTCN